MATLRQHIACSCALPDGDGARSSLAQSGKSPCTREQPEHGLALAGPQAELLGPESRELEVNGSSSSIDNLDQPAGGDACVESGETARSQIHTPDRVRDSSRQGLGSQIVHTVVQDLIAHLHMHHRRPIGKTRVRRISADDDRRQGVGRALVAVDLVTPLGRVGLALDGDQIIVPVVVKVRHGCIEGRVEDRRDLAGGVAPSQVAVVAPEVFATAQGSDQSVIVPIVVVIDQHDLVVVTGTGKTAAHSPAGRIGRGIGVLDVPLIEARETDKEQVDVRVPIKIPRFRLIDA